jgi:hypothetical protein
LMLGPPLSKLLGFPGCSSHFGNDRQMQQINCDDQVDPAGTTRAWPGPAARSALLKLALAGGLALTSIACRETLDAGHSAPHGKLPVDDRNPVILLNDWGRDNWFGEDAILLANSGGPPLAGLIVTTSKYWGDIDANGSTWTNLLTAARNSGLQNLPSVTPSTPPVLQSPPDGVIEATMGTESAGAKLIVDRSKELARPSLPLVVVTGTRLTDVANAFLMDRTVVDRVVVVSSLGGYAAPNATMDGPNGELDPWADWIVAHRFRTYVQISAYYQQTSDVTASDLSSLPTTPFGEWIRNKQPDIRMLDQAADQIAILSVGVSDFVVDVQRFSPDPNATFDNIFGPPLQPDANGNAWVVTKSAAPLAKARLWEMILKTRK